MIRGFEFFAGSQHMTNTFNEFGFVCQSLDLHQLRSTRLLDYKMNFLDFDYKSIAPDSVDFLYFGLPCTCWSKASGGRHFFKSNTPKTLAADNAIVLMSKMFDIIDYFKNAIFYIENPAGGLVNNHYFKNFLVKSQAYTYRIFLGNYGFCTAKQTDIFTNSSIPILSNPIHRVNGKYQKNKFDSLSTKKRQEYPREFCLLIVENFSTFQREKNQKNNFL